MHETNTTLYPNHVLITYILPISYVEYRGCHTSILFCRDKEKVLFVYSLTLRHCINFWVNEMTNYVKQDYHEMWNERDMWQIGHGLFQCNMVASACKD
jgi:hypothetical protein